MHSVSITPAAQEPMDLSQDALDPTKATTGFEATSAGRYSEFRETSTCLDVCSKKQLKVKCTITKAACHSPNEAEGE